MEIQSKPTEMRGCPIERTVQVMGGKWKPMILYYLYEDKKRISELQRLIPTASRRMLTKHLRELEADGLIHREVYKEVPPRVEYWTTPLGDSLRPVLLSMLHWAEEHADELDRASTTAQQNAR
ncbi:MAG: helix-turn-helix domain-containing protein [Chloroflexota bacterium]